MSTILFDPCCKGCLSQELYGENRCAGCRYFEPSESGIDRRPILYIDQKQLDEIKVEEARLRIKRSVEGIKRGDVKDSNDYTRWIDESKGIAQEALNAVEDMKIRAIPSSRNEADYQLVKRALLRLKRLDEQV